MTGQPDMFGAPNVGGERDARDRYFTPAWCTLALLDYLGERIAGPQIIWEPCCGANHVAKVLAEQLPKAITLPSDIQPASAWGRELDFLSSCDFWDGWPEHRPSWIVTNPPYRTARGDSATDFVVRALELATVGVAMLLRVAWLEPCADRYEIFRDDPPTDYVVLPRVNYIGAPGSNNQTSVWFVWDRRRQVGQGGYVRVKHYPADIREPGFDWSRLGAA